jgi:hypothetical protein
VQIFRIQGCTCHYRVFLFFFSCSLPHNRHF